MKEREAVLLTVAEVAEYLNISKSTVRRMIDSNRMPVVRCSKRVVRIDAADLPRPSGAVDD